MKSKLRCHTLLLTCANCLSRCLGFLIRLLLARLLSPEALGVMEMSSAAGMLALTPVTAGIPSAMSRVTARHGAGERKQVLAAGLSLIGRMCMLLIPAWLLLTPAVAWLLGDLRTMPALAAFAPAMLLAGLCGVYSGYCFGQEKPRLPALVECAEQLARFAFSAIVLIYLQNGRVALAAALPFLARVTAELCAVLLFRLALPLPRRRGMPSSALRAELLRLSAPLMFTQVCGAGMRALNAVLLPVCLRQSGLSQAAATAQYGLLGGMAMPLVMAPGVITGALCVVSVPVIAKLEHQSQRLAPLKRRLYLASGAIGAAACAGLYTGAGFLSSVLFGQIALAPLLRVMSPLALLMSVRQVQFGMVTGLGLQRQAVGGTLVSSLTTLLMTAWLCPVPQLRLFGAAYAMIAGHLAALAWNSAVLVRAARSAAQ